MKSIVIGGSVVGLIILMGVGAVWYSKNKVGESEILPTPTQIQQQTSSELLSFEIVPSYQEGNELVYRVGAEAVIKGKRLAKVELWQQGGGTGIYTDPSGRGALVGEAVRTSTEDNLEIWSYPLPDSRLFISLTAYAYNEHGEEIGKKMLSGVVSE